MTCNNPGEKNGRPSGGAFAPPLLFILCLGIFGDGGDWPLATFAIRAGLFLLFCAFLLRCTSPVIRINVIDAIVMFLWLLGALSLARGGYRWIAYQWFLHHTAALVLYVLLRALPATGDRFPAAAGFLLLASAVIQVLVAIFQKAVQGEGRPYGTLANPNFLAEFLVYAVAAAWYWGRWENGGVPRKAGSLALVFLFLAGIGLTRSRGGFLLAATIGAFLLADRVGWRKAAVSVAVVVAAVLLVPSPLQDRFLGRGDPFAFERINMWKASVRIFLENPFGVGVGHFKYYWHIVRDPVEGSIIRYAKAARTPHSEFFSVLSELGLPGMIGFLGLGAAGLVSLRRALSRRDPVVLSAIAVLFASFLHSFLEYNYHVFGLLLINAAALAIVAGRLWQPLMEREVPMRAVTKGLCIVLLGLFVAYSGMTYAGTVLDDLGSTAFRAGRMEEANGSFARAAATDPWRATYPDSASAARYRLYEDGKGKDHLIGAIEMEQEAYLRNPKDYRYPARLGYLYSKAADHFAEPGRSSILASASESYDRGIALNPHGADLRYLKASFLARSGRPSEARTLIESALEDEPRFVKGWLLLAELLENEDAGAALAAYDNALRVHSAYRDRAVESYEKEFVELDGKMVEKRVQALRSKLGK
ncbi:MAG: O-antigen ligase family protein [Deltaproteobacteria bacterium]